MPFQVFRRHQRKMMAFLAIFAMVAFTLDFSLFRSQFGPGRENPLVATLYGRKVRFGDLQAMRVERSRANRFMALVTGRPDYFGGLDTSSMVDAMILQHEADRLGLPVDHEFASRWLRQQSGNQLTAEMFDRIYRQQFANEITDAGLLETIANQVRIEQVLRLPGLPVVTPMDLFEAYREQNERVSAFAVPFPVEDYVKDVTTPSDSELKAFFDTYKDILPDRLRDTPGFKIPQKVQVEYISTDSAELARQIESRLTDQELRDVFTTRSSDFPVPPAELPVNLFANDPDARLTPRAGDPFLEVRDIVLRTVARERANEEIDRKFGQIRDEVFNPFSDRYARVLDGNEEAKEQSLPLKPLPTPGDILKDAAAKESLTFERTAPMDRVTAASHGQIGSARAGGRLGGGEPFADAFFDAKQPLYDVVELSDEIGRRFLAWKIADFPARVPELSEVRDQVIHDWKFDKARDLARKAADTLAAKASEAGGDIQKANPTRPVLSITPVPKMQAGIMLNAMQAEPARPSEILQIPDAGEALRDVYFQLQPKEVKVAPNQPKSIYYVLGLNQRFPAELAGLFSDFGGQRFLIQREAQSDAYIKRIRDWLGELRVKAGLTADWVPPAQFRESRQG